MALGIVKNGTQLENGVETLFIVMIDPKNTTICKYLMIVTFCNISLYYHTPLVAFICFKLLIHKR